MDQSKVDTLISFGFQEDIARKALRASVKFPYLLNILGAMDIMYQFSCGRLWVLPDFLGLAGW